MKNILIFLITFTATLFGKIEHKSDLSSFCPKGYVVFEKIYGDLNKDGIEDCVLIIKGTDKSKIIDDEDLGKLDRNRRGIIILFNKKDHYELAIKNYGCFESENEDGGIYSAPDLTIEIKKEKLIVNYKHGRYGYWEYIFRFQNLNFELIGYKSIYKSNYYSDWVIFDEESINFLSKKKLTKEVINVSKSGKEKYKEIWEDTSVNGLLKLSEIKDFDELHKLILNQK